MKLSILAHLQYRFAEPTDILLQIEAAATSDQHLDSAALEMSETQVFVRIAAQDGVGERIWLRAAGLLTVDYRAILSIRRDPTDWDALTILPPAELPAETVQYLMDSAYCRGSRFRNFVLDRFAEVEGGAKVMAMREWIATNIAYASRTSGGDTNALDSFVAREGVCRDFAHVMIALARAAAIPARIVSAYAPGVEPPDFHAVVELFLGTGPGQGAWHLVDATGMADERDIARIGVGRDAADVAFLTTYGNAELVVQSVNVARLG